jgi:hypothetical protein
MSTPPSEVEEFFEKFIRDKRYLKSLFEDHWVFHGTVKGKIGET